jgi:hypothetical protein
MRPDTLDRPFRGRVLAVLRQCGGTRADPREPRLLLSAAAALAAALIRGDTAARSIDRLDPAALAADRF